MRSVLLSVSMGSILSQSLATSPTECINTWRFVSPSDAGITNVNATNRYQPHFVTAHPTTSETDILRVFLPGTGGTPAGSEYLLKSIAGCSRPTIGLSYNFIPFADAQRNEICSNATSTDDALSECLSRQHSDSLFGSQPGINGLWPAVAQEDSVQGRLTQLLKYLGKWYSNEGWERFMDGDLPRWDRIMMSGHSQGAGHTGYLAQTTALAGAVLLSGPQDECINCAAGPDNLWLSQPWATKHVKAAAHINESASDVIQANWRNMVNTLEWPAEPTDIGATALVPPPYGAALSEVPYNPAYNYGRPFHVSMAGDMAIPMTTVEGKQVAVYSLALWPALFADPPAAESAEAVAV